MIKDDCRLYVVDQGFVKPSDLNIGNQVYVLDENRVPGIRKVTSISTDWVSGKVYTIDSGAQNVEVTEDARMLYHSDKFGSKFISWKQIPELTPDKQYSAHKYTPVLSWCEYGDMNCTVQELESVARMCTVLQYDRDAFRDVFNRCTPTDAWILIDMLEFWLSVPPGGGRFGRMHVKSRSHVIKDIWVVNELMRIAVIAGYTASITKYPTPFTYALQVNYEGMPIPGSRPKNEKYFLSYTTGLFANVNADNLPILGISKSRCFYLPTTSTKNMI